MNEAKGRPFEINITFYLFIFSTFLFPSSSPSPFPLPSFFILHFIFSFSFVHRTSTHPHSQPLHTFTSTAQIILIRNLHTQSLSIHIFALSGTCLNGRKESKTFPFPFHLGFYFVSSCPRSNNTILTSNIVTSTNTSTSNCVHPPHHTSVHHSFMTSNPLSLQHSLSLVHTYYTPPRPRLDFIPTICPSFISIIFDLVVVSMYCATNKSSVVEWSLLSTSFADSLKKQSNINAYSLVLVLVFFLQLRQIQPARELTDNNGEREKRKKRAMNSRAGE